MNGKRRYCTTCRRAGGAIRQADAGLRSFLIRRQNAIHATLMGTGIHFGVRSMLGEPALVSEAAAFIMVGGVGLIMSLTSMDIGQSLKEAVREEGDKTRAALRDTFEAMDKRMEERDRRIEERLEGVDKRMEERDRRIEERLEGVDKRMEERDRRIEESIDRMSTAIETLARESSGIFKHMLETQNRILDKMS